MNHSRTTRETFSLKVDEFLKKLDIKPISKPIETFIYYDGKKIGPVKDATSIIIETNSVENNISQGNDETTQG